ncbi:unnamed protein product [Phaedon cochleariae]|uniref:C2H2-type domain-containing protein n=1 Tax=Phaedon cochleariae TaxID=80249 RepID=A0A9N9SF24_PHACE|nr:unnamed protein product [Phaedon cochleariae]
MDIMAETPCRLCLNLVENNYEPLEGIVENMLKELQLNVTLSVTNQPVLCSQCAENLQKSFEFKSVYIEDIKLPRLLYEEEYKDDTVTGVCYFCMVVRKSPANKEDKQTFMKEMLKNVSPQFAKIDDELYFICSKCTKPVTDFVNFMRNCLRVEEKIEKYRKIHGTNIDGQVDLHSVKMFGFGEITSEIESVYIKEEFTEENQKNESIDHATALDGKIYYRYSCIQCPFVSNHKKNFNKHLRYHENPNIVIHKCDICSYESEFKSNVRIHKDIHKDKSELTMHKCTLCSYEAKNKWALSKHMCVHTDVALYKCALCPYEGKQKLHLERHMLKHSDPSELEMHKCPVCPHQTKYIESLRQHLLLHKSPSEVKMYSCEYCGYQTRIRSNLKVHVLIHKDPSEIQMFKCDYCPYEAKSRGRLNNHVTKHKERTEMKMHKCPLCDYEAKFKSLVGKHMVRHKILSEDEWIRCDMCSFKAKRRENVNRHMLGHKDTSEVKMFKCNSCSYEARHKASLSLHVLRHMDPSQIEMLKCKFCPFEAKHRIYMNSHILKCHKQPTCKPMIKVE